MLNSDALQQQLLSSKPVGVSMGVAKHNLKLILAQREFSALMRQPSWWDRLKLALERWIGEHLQALFKAMAQHPTTSQIIFWGAAFGALALIAFVLFRIFASEEQRAWIPTTAAGLRQRNSADWIKAARTSGQASDFNKAIQCVYWAAVVWLETAGVLAKTNGLTPRELLRSIATRNEAGEFRNLTLSLERFWYARGSATDADYAACLRSLEALGCPVE